jgi:hypothetical protein
VLVVVLDGRWSCASTTTNNGSALVRYGSTREILVTNIFCMNVQYRHSQLLTVHSLATMMFSCISDAVALQKGNAHGTSVQPGTWRFEYLECTYDANVPEKYVRSWSENNKSCLPRQQHKIMKYHINNKTVIDRGWSTSTPDIILLSYWMWSSPPLPSWWRFQEGKSCPGKTCAFYCNMRTSKKHRNRVIHA